MRERPIIFSGSMVRAILDGRKTMTRRVVKPQPPDEPLKRPRQKWGWVDGSFFYCGIRCPFGKPGDHLWCRETFYVDEEPYASGARLPSKISDINPDSIYYRADGECCEQIPECQCADVGKPKWRPSIFIPRWASRITLEIESVRVERLQDISEEDAVAEGCEGTDNRTWDDPAAESLLPSDQFTQLWDKIKGNKHPWVSNPFCWCISFKTI